MLQLAPVIGAATTGEVKERNLFAAIGEAKQQTATTVGLSFVALPDIAVNVNYWNTTL